jgi:hypothetical protein
MSGGRGDLYVHNEEGAPALTVRLNLGAGGGMLIQTVAVAVGGTWHLDLLNVHDPNMRIRVTSAPDPIGIEWTTKNAYTSKDIHLYVAVKPNGNSLGFSTNEYARPVSATGFAPYNEL